MEYSDYIIFIDESGSADLRHVDRYYPLLVLCCAAVKISDYIEHIVPSLQRFKFDFWGHDQAILHEIDIRKRRQGFEFLQNKEAQQSFLAGLADIVAGARFQIVAAVLNKNLLSGKFVNSYDPYELALQFCLERLAGHFCDQNQSGKRVHVIFEKCGKKEDSLLELSFRRILDGEGPLPAQNMPRIKQIEWVPLFVSKKSNSTGLQLADLCARPIGLSALRPNQTNRAFDIIKEKIAYRKDFP